MSSILTLILSYLTISILVFGVSSRLFYKHRKRKEAEFTTNFAILEEAIKQKSLENLLEAVNNLLWNPNMSKKHYMFVLEEMKLFSDNNIEVIEMQKKIETIFEKKGWNVI